MESSFPTSTQPKTFRRGEVIFKAGDAANELYLIQSGLATLNITRGGKVVELTQVGVGQLLGEEALWGAARWSVTAVANNDVRALPVNLPQAFAMMAAGSPLLKIFLKSLIEKERGWWSSLIESKAEADPTPCPAARVTQLFAVLYHAARYTGSLKKGALVIVWPTFKKYCQRTFLESPVRLEQAVNILVKLGAAKLEMIPCETDPEAPDELGFVHFTDIERVRRFYEFYRGLKNTQGRKGAPEIPDEHRDVLLEIEQWNKLGKVVLPLPAEKEAA